MLLAILPINTWHREELARAAATTPDRTSLHPAGVAG
jgi:hypothetical protein